MKIIFAIRRLKYLLREKLRELILIPQMYSERKSLLVKLAATPCSEQPIKSLLLLTPHTSNPFASRGDEAMLVAVVSKFKSKQPEAQCSILVEPSIEPEALARLRELGVKAITSWSYPWKLSAQAEHLKTHDALFCIGADVMDGYYSAIKSLRLWMCADLMAHMGKASTIGGFSFNQAPSKHIVDFAQDQVSSNLNICLRDPVSYRRFKNQCNSQAQLVADNAFMLEAKVSSAYTNQVVSWVEERKAAGRVVCALNLHPILIKDRDPEVLEKLVQSAITTAKALIQEDNLSIVLLPHDFRDSNTGDLWFLNQVHRALEEYRGDIFFVDQEIPACDIKFIASCMELVVTGRMHLAIGALGTGTPVMGVTYQGKFEGLIEHFQLPDTLLTSPNSLLCSNFFTSFFRGGLAQLDTLNATIAGSLEAVKSNSYKNMANLVEH